MGTNCYSLVRGQAIRVTGLTARGALPDPIPHVVSKSVVKVTIDEVSEGGGHEMLRNESDERRILLRRSAQTIRYLVSVDFLRVDPGLLSLLVGVPLVSKAQEGQFGADAFGVFPFGGGESTLHTGFDANTRLRPAAFAMEVWTKLAGECQGQYGYTLFPFLKGGRLSGFSFSRDGLVSFNLKAAQTRRMSRWGRGPYDLGLDETFGGRLGEPVSGNTNWRQTIVPAAPPVQTDGIVTFRDVIDGGTATMTTSDVLDGGTALVTSSDVVDGGRA